MGGKAFLVFTFPGSQEECWQLQIVAKGRVSCPKCKSVSRKTVEGLKKHMENCRQVRRSREPEADVQYLFKQKAFAENLFSFCDRIDD